MPDYDYEIMLQILTPNAPENDLIRKDILKVRAKTPPDKIARFSHVRGANTPPTWLAGKDPKTLAEHMKRLNEAPRSRLTLFAHGLPPFIAADFGPDNQLRGYTGEEMANLLKEWGLKKVTRISLMSCHAAVSRKLLSIPKEEQADFFSFHNDKPMNEILKKLGDTDRVELKTLLDKHKELENTPTGKSIRLLFGSLAAQLHKHLGKDPGGVRTEITARMAAVVTDEERNLVKYKRDWAGMGGTPLDAEENGMAVALGYRVPWSKFRFYWDDKGKRRIDSVYQAKLELYDDGDEELIFIGYPKKRK